MPLFGWGWTAIQHYSAFTQKSTALATVGLAADGNRLAGGILLHDTSTERRLVLLGLAARANVQVGQGSHKGLDRVGSLNGRRHGGGSRLGGLDQSQRRQLHLEPLSCLVDQRLVKLAMPATTIGNRSGLGGLPVPQLFLEAEVVDVVADFVNHGQGVQHARAVADEPKTGVVVATRGAVTTTRVVLGIGEVDRDRGHLEEFLDYLLGQLDDLLLGEVLVKKLGVPLVLFLVVGEEHGSGLYASRGSDVNSNNLKSAVAGSLVCYTSTRTLTQTPRTHMRRNEAEFTVNIPMPGEEPLRGKFKVKVKLSYRDILNMDAIRRQLLGPQGGDADGMAALISQGVAKIRVHALETPSWWRDADNGLDFEDINVVLTVLTELNKVEKDYLDDIQKAAGKAAEDLKKETP